MIDHLDIAVALVVVSALAWDIARRYLQPRDAAQYTQLKENQQDIAVDILAVRDQVNATNAELLKTDKVVENLAKEWLARFEQLESSTSKVETDVLNKVGGAIAQLPRKGYNR